MLFCPICGGLLLLSDPQTSAMTQMAYECKNCPYRRVVLDSLDSLDLEVKSADDIMSTDRAWENGTITEQADCPACGHHRAFFMQIQIRSADEPMTTFLRCVDCHHRWRED